MDENTEIILNEIKKKIYTIRGVQVILDSDLAKFYKIETKVLNQTLKRNKQRFPEDFCFQLSKSEFEQLRSQFVTSMEIISLRSQTVTLENMRGKHNKYLPYAFTEQGVAMLSGLINSKIAIEINISIMRAFVHMRRNLKSNEFIFQKLDSIEKNHIKYEIESKNKFEKIFDLLESKTIEVKEGVFFEGQIFDAYNFVSNLVRKANNSIILIDNYIDDSILTLFIKRNNEVKVIIYTENISKQVKLDVEKYNSQYEPIEIKEIKNIHDRFLIIDNEEVYHFGASLKDLGKKLFTFSKLNKEGFKILDKLK